MRMRHRHQRRVASDVMGVAEPALTLKLLLHRLLASIAVLRDRPPQWRDILIGTWT